jgi:hypothetical protein
MCWPAAKTEISKTPLCVSDIGLEVMPTRDYVQGIKILMPESMILTSGSYYNSSIKA